MPNFGLLSLPYILKDRIRSKKCNFVSTHSYMHRIAYTETVSGLRDDVPTLLFHAPFTLIKDACQYLYTVMNGKVRDMRISNEHSCRVKNGKCYRRVAVQIIGLDEQFISLKEFTAMLVSYMMRICNCKVRHYRLETFLNL